MNNSIAINDNMPEELKAAISYLNENNVGLSQTIEGADDPIEFIDDESEGSTFTGQETNNDIEENFDVDDDEVDTDLTLEDVNKLMEDCIEEDNLDTSELDSIF